jgi:hypothetical protein
MEACKVLIKRGKYFSPPPDDGSDFKELFRQMAGVGAGRPVDKDGVPEGPWTPELLTDAISQIEANQSGVDLRTVQRWFQDNDQGIKADNIRWLAWIFGCGDPDAISKWQVELSAAQSRLTTKRRAKRKITETQAVQTIEATMPPNNASAVVANGRSWRFNLAKRTEALFGSHSSMALPLVVFTVATALGLISFTLNIHSVVFTPETGPAKQVGFLWAPNWTIVFLVVLPLYLALLIDLLRCWKEEWRPRLVAVRDPTLPMVSWERRLAAASYSYWAVFFVTVVIASGYNWTATYLIPLLEGNAGSWAVDWGRIAVFRPDLISVRSATIFTGLVFLYNGFTSYLFFTGLIFLHLMKYDYLDLVKGLENRSSEEPLHDIEDISFALMNGIFRCTSLGIVITILMKLQSSFLQSESVNLFDWLVADCRSLFDSHDSLASDNVSHGSAPGDYYSFFCLLAILGTFVNASIRIRLVLARRRLAKSCARFLTPWVVMNGAMALLVINYFLIGVFAGFTIFLLFSLVLTVYLLSIPAARWGQVSR